MLVTFAVTLGLAVGFLLLPASGTDLSAQQARTSFASAHPLSPVDLRWYSGVLPAAYSVIAPYVQALFGVRLTGALAAVAAATLLATLLIRWRVQRPLAAALWGSVVLVSNLVVGRTTFAVGLAFGLASLVAVPRRRRGWLAWVPACALAVLTALSSPVAAVFLGLVAVVWTLRERAVLAVAVSAGMPLLVVAALFPESGRMPFAWHVAWPVLLASAAVLALCRSPLVRLATVLYAAGALIVFFVPGPVGSNAERLAVLFTGVVLLACARAPGLLLVPVLAVVGWWALLVPSRDVRSSGAIDRERAASERLVETLRALGPIEGRIEVVPLLDHGEASVVADAWPLARGWERQVDVLRAPLFYRGTLTADRYRAWLDANAVEYVALAAHRHDWSAGGELRLLKAPPPWLHVVHRDAEWTVWRVAAGRGLVTGPAHASAVTPDRIVLEVRQAGRVPVDVRWSRWLTVSGDACLERSADGVTIVARSPGRVTLSSSYAAPLKRSRC